MATIKSYTDLQQSKKLAEILPLESADMCCFQNPNGSMNYYGFPISQANKASNPIPCWSLAALLSVVPTMIGSVVEKDALRLRIDKSETDFNIWYENLDTGMVEEGFDIIETNFIDVCYKMLLKLHELKML